VEALLLGVPVLGLDGGATPELVNEESGLLVAPQELENFDVLRLHLEKFVDREWDRKKIQMLARKKFIPDL